MSANDTESIKAEGPCGCKGEKCEGAWGWKWNTRDLGNQMHAGKLWMEPCPDYPENLKEWDLDRGEMMIPAPPGISPKNRNKYLNPQWGGRASEALRRSERAHEKITTAQIESGEHWNLKEKEYEKGGV